jgi:predicted solute-binding protein
MKKENKAISETPNETSSETSSETSRNRKITVRFVNTYIGELGVFYKNVQYELSKEQYEVLKKDCKEIE